MGGSRSGKTQKELFSKTLSGYALTDENEFFAEAFAQIMAKKMRPVSRLVKKQLDEWQKSDITTSIHNEENQRYGRNKKTTINNTYIESGEYRKKFDTLTENKDVNRILYAKAKEMLKHRSGTLLEDMYWIDSDTGEVVASVVDSKIPQAVSYSTSVQKAIRGKENLLTMHTHPNSIPPSIPDFNSSYIRKYRLSVVVCHDGKIFAYKANDFIREKIAELYIAEFRDSGYTEYEAQLRTLEKLQRQGVLEFWEVLPHEEK